MAKRLFDIFGALVALVLISPVMLIIALAVRVDSPGPAIFRHERIGLNGKPFKMHKFRSMVENASKNGPYFTEAGDSRITRIGKFLRKLSLDELPQIFNVLIGDMSLVGPRPDVMEQKDLYTEIDWRQRHQVKPGITGLAQAMGRSNLDFESRKEYDLKYVKECSFHFDLYILFKTLTKIGRDESN